MKTLHRIVLVAAFLPSGAAMAADREWIAYERLLEITRLDRFYAVPAAQRDQVRVLGTVKPNNPAIAAADIVFTVVRGSERRRISVNPDGSFDPAIDPVWARDNPQVLTSMPPGEKAGFSFAVTPVIPAGTQFAYAALMSSVKQSNALMRSQGVLSRFMLPTFAGIALQYTPGQAASATIRSGRGERTVSTDARGVLTLPADEALAGAQAQVTLSHRPQSADFIMD